MVNFIQPIAIQKMRMAAPAVLRRVGGVVVGVIVQRHVDRRVSGDVAVIFLFQRVAVILEMVKNIERAVPRIFHQAWPNLFAAQKRAKARRGRNLGLPNFGPAADGDDEII